ncbi:DMT family transporter [Agrobacterium cavarae]|uniref:DMT family transporter n=1 Tax=Agrobacterium cavarae TaxID=2528239 RepID=A0ABY1Y619_9HYPH|nr:DMT family transporter [Agrobacterium cavarae]TBN09454.1 DMT family transporter [Agrobacterium cavarae]
MTVIQTRPVLENRRPSASAWADLALLGVALVWGASYPVAKSALVLAPVLVLIFCRFLLTALAMSLIAGKELTSTNVYDRACGILLGAILFAIFIAETYGVTLTSATNTALIISLCVVFTPILDYGLSRRLPPLGIIGATASCCVGVGVLTGGNLTFTGGDLLVLAAAVLRAVMVVATKRLMATRTMSTAALTAIQAWTVALSTMLMIIVLGKSDDLFFAGDTSFWLAVAFLSLFCTIAAFYVQNAAVRRTSPTRVSLLMGTEPLFGFLLAHALLSEPITTTSLVGASLIVAGTFAGILFENRKLP